jgi:hypothetical protein
MEEHGARQRIARLAFIETGVRASAQRRVGYFNMSHGEDARGPRNERSGSWPEWEFTDDPIAHVRAQSAKPNARATNDVINMC